MNRIVTVSALADACPASGRAEPDTSHGQLAGRPEYAEAR